MLVVKYGRHNHEIMVNDTMTIADLKMQLTERCDIPIDRQILVSHGKTILDNEIISQLPKGVASSVTLIGSSATVVAPTKTEILQQKRIINDLPATDASKFGRTADGVDGDGISTKYRVSIGAVADETNRRENASRQYKFNNIETLPNFPLESTATARQILTSLSQDKGIVHAMQKFQLEVGSLCEMYPEGKVGESAVCVMGLNVNKGEKILLRIRTDDLKGFRKHLSIRKVLYHELAHNRHGDHDDKFYVFMRQIEAEVNSFNGGVNASLTPEGSGSTVRSTGDVGMAEVGVFRLGGSDSECGGESGQSRRLRIREATLNRHRQLGHHIPADLTDADIEAEYNCGCVDAASLCVEISRPHQSPTKIEAETGSSSSDSDNTSVPAATHAMTATTGIVGSYIPVIPDTTSRKESGDLALDMASEADADLCERLTNRINTLITDAIVGEGDIGPVEKLTEVKDYLDAAISHFMGPARHGDGARGFNASLSLVCAIVRNIKDKRDAKFRQLRTTSGAYSRLIRGVPGCVGLIRLAGFEPAPTATDPEHLVVPERRLDVGWLYILVSILDTVLQEVGAC